MKKFTLLAVAAVALCATSCKKEYTCECTTTFSYGAGISKDEYKDDSEAYSKKMSKKTAESACDNKQASIDASYKNAFTDNGADPAPGVTAKTDCDLKD